MQLGDEIMRKDSDLNQLRRVKAHKKRRCPHCQSDKWTWLGAVPITPEELEQHLLVRYRCDNCQNEFLVEEAKGSQGITAIPNECNYCHSSRLVKTSRQGADVQIWQCQQCNGYMVLEQPEEDGENSLDAESPGVIIVDK
jgi:DNA-directed RNA polymerase subunit RPC12/RpoP